MKWPFGSRKLATTAPAGPARAAESPSPTILAGRYETRFVRLRGILHANDFEGFDPILGRRVALQLGAASLFDENLRSGFSGAMTLAHPNLVNVLDHGASPKEMHGEYGNEAAWLIVTELFDGPSLRESLTAGQPTPAAEAVRIARALLAGLEVLHNVQSAEIGLVTPSRVQLTSTGEVRLLHPLIREYYDGPCITAADELLFAPMRASDLDASKDWCYSLGILLHELITGIGPVNYRPRKGPFFAHAAAPPPSGIAPVDQRFDGVVATAMAELAEHRFASPAVFAAALAACRV